MVKDFAKPATPAREPASRWVFFITGFCSGGFCAFLLWLWLYNPPAPGTVAALPVTPAPAATDSAPDAPPEYDFFELLPSLEVPLVGEYAEEARAVNRQPGTYVLQAGSFKSRGDADRVRAELILRGLDVTIQDKAVDGVTWHRVLVGPLDTAVELGRAQNTLAEAGVESLAIRVPAP